MTASLLAPLSGDFGAESALELALIGAACGAVGVWVLYFGQAILAESFTHALLPGLVLATIAGAGLLAGAALGVVCAYALLLLALRAPRTSTQSGVFAAVTTLVALGALLASQGKGAAALESLLFGDPLAPSGGGVLGAGAIAILIGALLWILGPQLAALAFDPGSAAALGVDVRWISAAALGLLALSVSAAANVAGSLLALALVTGPAYGALAVCRRLSSSLLLAAVTGAASGVCGIYVAYYANWPASSGVALVICGWALLAASLGALRTRIAQLG